MRNNKQKIITIINQDSGYLMIDIANAYAKEGYRVNLITGKLKPRNTKLNNKIKVIKIIKYERNTIIKRVFTWVWAFIQLAIKLKINHRKDYLLISSNPPIAPLLPLILSNSFSLLIYDIYPDILEYEGILKKKSSLLKWWQKANLNTYKRANKIYTLTESMKCNLANYVDYDHIEVVPIWTDNIFLKPIAQKDNRFITKHGLQNKFIILYSGNMGYTHKLDTLISVAELIKNPNIIFLLIGDGDQKEFIQKKVQELRISNCKFLPWQQIDELPYSLASANLGVVSIGEDSSSASIPSKTYNLMSVGAPLLCLGKKGSDLEQLLLKYQNGKFFSHNEVQEISIFVQELALDRKAQKTLSENSLVASLNYTDENAKRFIP